MRHLSVSHIAWPPAREEEFLEILRDQGLETMEAAPLRTFGNPFLATESNVREKADWYRDRGFKIGSFQALLFGAEGVFLFEDEASRLRLKEWLIAIARVGAWCGAGPMVFGSPKNRLKGSLSHTEAMEAAVSFFREVANSCAAGSSYLVMEANPEAYGADFCTKLEQAAELVARVDSPGFRLHVDAGGLALGGEDFESVIRQSASLIGHVHASQPGLDSWAEPNPVHAKLSRVLDGVGYTGMVALEMSAGEPYRERVAEAICGASRAYGLLNSLKNPSHS